MLSRGRLIKAASSLYLLIHFYRDTVFLQLSQYVKLNSISFRAPDRILLQGLLSDGLLAHRFWVIFDRKRWALYIPATFVIVTGSACKFLAVIHRSRLTQHNPVLGLGESLVNLGVYIHRGSLDYYFTLGVDVLKISAAWGWSMFFVNTVMTLSILVKIMYVSAPS